MSGYLLLFNEFDRVVSAMESKTPEIFEIRFKGDPDSITLREVITKLRKTDKEDDYFPRLLQYAIHTFTNSIFTYAKYVLSSEHRAEFGNSHLFSFPDSFPHHAFPTTPEDSDGTRTSFSSEEDDLEINMETSEFVSRLKAFCGVYDQLHAGWADLEKGIAKKVETEVTHMLTKKVTEEVLKKGAKKIAKEVMAEKTTEVFRDLEECWYQLYRLSQLHYGQEIKLKKYPEFSKEQQQSLLGTKDRLRFFSSPRQTSPRQKGSATPPRRESDSPTSRALMQGRA